MPLRFPCSLPAAFLVAILAGSSAPAANEGQQDFLDAVRAKLNVRMLSDLDEVVRLCESAVAKGLDEENTRLANKLLAAALIDRAAMYSKTAFGGRGSIRSGGTIAGSHWGTWNALCGSIRTGPRRPSGSRN